MYRQVMLLLSSVCKQELNTGCLKRMAQFKKLTRNLILTLQGQKVHR
jgi:hypothetical protein